MAFITATTAICTAQGGPPLRTDDPGTPGNGNWEINIAATADRRPQERVYETPLLDVNYGLGERIQVKFEIPWVIRTAPEPTKAGLGNSLVGFKWRLYENKKRALDISAYPQCEFNNPNSSADRGLVDRGVRFLLPVEATEPIGPLNFNAEVGYLITQFGSDEWIAGLAAGRQVKPRLELLAEIYNSGKTDGTEHDTSFGLGGRFQLREHMLLLFMVGRSFPEAETEGPRVVGYAGLQFQIPKDWRERKIPVGVPEPH
jgi:hypothetical protein